MKLRQRGLIEELRRRYGQKWHHSDVQTYLHNDLGIDVSIRTLKRWKKFLAVADWQGPCAPCPCGRVRIDPETIVEVIRLRRTTGWGSYAVKHLCPGISDSSIKRLIKRMGLSRGSKIEDQRVHWVKWQRAHPDSLWQVDSWQLPDGSWVIDVIDDCSRYCFCVKHVQTLSTAVMIATFEAIITVHGKPREILTDNGAEHGLRSKMSKFDQWCNQQGIKHIRSRIHKPTTAGKVERFHQTVQNELPYCQGDFDLFRYRYNHIRPHMSLHGQRPADVYFSIEARLRTPTHSESPWW